MDTRSYDERFDDLARLAYRVSFRIVGHREEARDLTQEAMARAYARWPHVEARAAGWISRVATNLALDVVRRRRHEPPRPTDGASDVAAHAALRTDLAAALRSLTARQRDVVVLRYLADLSEADVAATLGCDRGSVKKHASRGLAKLRDALGPSLPLDDDARPKEPADA